MIYPKKLTKIQIEILRGVIDATFEYSERSFKEWLQRENENETFDVSGYNLLSQTLADLSIVFSDEYDGVEWENENE